MDSLLQELTLAIPVYNDANFIEAAVESCIGQAGRIVIYDNCSTDGTSEICSRLVERHPEVEYIRHPENIGAFENFKQSLFACKTEYFSWVGGHDILDKDYTSKLLPVIDKDPEAALIAGTIVYIDETGAKTGKVTRTHWANETKGRDSLTRAGICITEIKDCSIFYGIYRASLARSAWFDTPCLGFDRILLGRVAAAGNILFEPSGTFFARNLDNFRKGRNDTDRRIAEVGRESAKPLPRNLFLRNKWMVQTVLDQANTPEELTRALRYISKINRRYQSRRYYQKLRIAVAACAAGLLLCAWALLNR